MNRLKAISAGLLLLTAMLGCGHGIQGTLAANKPPQIEITCGAVRSKPDSLTTLSFVATFCWSSYDPDGFVDYFEYALAPLDTLAAGHPIVTKLNTVTVSYKANGSQVTASSSGGIRNIPFTKSQQFLVRSVDNRGGHSPWSVEYFNALSVAPRTTIRVPTCTPGSYGTTGPTITVRWDGTDPDSPDPKKLPLKYHFYFKDITPAPGIYGPAEAATLIRGTLRTGVQDSVGADTTTKIYKLLTGHTYCLIIKAEDIAGVIEPYPTLDEGADNDYTDYNTLGKNCVFFTASSSIVGASLTIFVGSQQKTFAGYDPTNFLTYQGPTNTPISVQWIASAASYGGEIDNYSYSLDIDDPTSDNPKVIRPGGFTWTSPDARSTSTTLNGYPTKGTHYFYVRVFDNSGFRTIGTVQIEVIPITFSKPLLFILDSPGINSGVPTTEFLTKEELKEYWSDILESDRFYVDVSDTIQFPGGRCLPMRGKVDFYVPTEHPLNEGLPLTIMGDYRVLVWACPYASLTSRVKTVLHRMIDPNSGLANNLYTYLQAGGNVWGLGGGFAQQCAIAFGYPEIPNGQDNRFKYPGGRSNAIGPFAFDFLGNRGGDTLFSSAPPSGIAGELNPNLSAVLPYPVPFLRETAFGKKLTTINPIQIDKARYDTMLTSIYQGRRDRAPNARPEPGTYELIGRAVFPDGYDPNPEMATWQPIAIARSIGSQSAARVATGVFCAINNSVIGWYKKGTTLAGNGQPVLAPYELYFTGFPAELFYREQVRDLATVILETKGWNIWRGNCPPNAARLTLERQAELERNLERLSRNEARQFEQQGGSRVSAVPMAQRRR